MIGPRGYMFAVKKVDSIYIAKHISNLTIPEYLQQLPSFINTIKTLYYWRNYHLQLRDKIVTALITREDDDFFSGITGADDENRPTSPNVYLTPTKSKKNNHQVA